MDLSGSLKNFGLWRIRVYDRLLIQAALVEKNLFIFTLALFFFSLQNRTAFGQGHFFLKL